MGDEVLATAGADMEKLLNSQTPSRIREERIY
jgi:hypothetical protein